MKIILLLFITLTFSFSSCKIKADKDYFVGDNINPNIYSHCSQLSKSIFSSRYFISKNSNFYIDSIKKENDKNIITLPKNIKIHFKGRVVENANGKIKVKDNLGRLQVYNIKELLQ